MRKLRQYKTTFFWKIKIALLFLGLLSSPGRFSHTLAAPQKIEAVASFSILNDLVKNIAGDKINITTLVGPNSDAHVFQPSPETAKKISRAEIVFINGLKFEPWLDRLLTAVDFQGKICNASKDITPIILFDPKTADPVQDPHAWHSVKNSLLYVKTITQCLCELDPTNKDVYTKNLKGFEKKLEDLEKWTEKKFKAINPLKRKIITAHDAFNYLGQDYQIAFRSPTGISTDAKPSAKIVAELIKQIKNENIKAIFVENIADQQLIKQIAEETSADITNNILYSDALSEPQGPASTYIEMMTYNVNKLATAMHKN
jgi:zinc/manganese transport system substrate-binding protein